MIKAPPLRSELSGCLGRLSACGGERPQGVLEGRQGMVVQRDRRRPLHRVRRGREDPDPVGPWHAAGLEAVRSGAWAAEDLDDQAADDESQADDLLAGAVVYVRRRRGLGAGSRPIRWRPTEPGRWPGACPAS